MSIRPIARRIGRLAAFWADRIESAGRQGTRYGLVLVLLWIGGMKFTVYEVEAISGLVSNSPLLSWASAWVGPRPFSGIVGVAEIAIALLVAARPLSARAASIGGALGVGMFLTTLSFLLTTPGVWEPSANGFPALSVVPGQFLIKDTVLLGGSLWVWGEAWRSARQARSSHGQGVASSKPLVEP